MAKTIEQLKAQSAEVKNASVIGENTATRVGSLFNDIVEHVEAYEAGQAQKDTEQSTSIDAETARATAAETTLSERINQEVTDRKAMDETIGVQLNDEIERAKGMELGISTKLNDEIDRAQAAEEANAQAIEAEAEARDLAINAEAQARTQNDQLLSQAITAERDRAIVAEQANAQAIEAESARAEAAGEETNIKLTNIIADLATLETSAANMRLTEEPYFTVCDPDGNIAVLISEAGFDTSLVSEHLITLLKNIEGLGSKKISELYRVDGGYVERTYWRMNNGIGSSPYLRINTYGNLVHRCSNKIPVKMGDKVHVSFYGSGTAAGWCLCDENDAIYLMDETLTKGEVDLDIAKDGYLYVNDMRGDGGRYAKITYTSPESAELTRSTWRSLKKLENKEEQKGLHIRPFPYGKRDAKILFLGNSYTDDSTAYLMEFIEAAGLDVSTACMYYTFVSGATFEKYCEILDNGTSYTLKNVIGTFTGMKTGTLQTLLSNDWDIVILQQGSEHSKDFNLWQPWLNKLIQAIRINNPKNPCIAYHMTWNPWYYSNEVYKGNATYINIGYEQIVDGVKKINSLGIDYIIPTGTAIQNVRFSSLNTVHNLHRDEKHLAFGVARYTAAACIFGTIICDLFDVSLYGNSAIHTVTEGEITDSSDDYLVDNADVTSENNKKIQELVISALDNMYNVTIIE